MIISLLQRSEYLIISGKRNAIRASLAPKSNQPVTQAPTTQELFRAHLGHEQHTAIV
jgi:hypothetical protein